MVRGLVFHAAAPAKDMGGLGKEGEQGEITGRHPPEPGGRDAGGEISVWSGRLHRPGDGADLIEQRHAGGAERRAEIGSVLISGRNDRSLRQDISENGGGMQGAVAFSRPDIDIDHVWLQADGVDDHGAEDGAEDTGQIGGGQLYISLDDGLIEVKNRAAFIFELADDCKRRHTNNTDPFAALGVDSLFLWRRGHLGGQLFCLYRKKRPRAPKSRWILVAASRG